MILVVLCDSQDSVETINEDVGMNLLETQRIMHADMSRLEKWAEKVGGSFETLHKAHYECVENIMLKVKKIEQKLVMMQAKMSLHHHTLEDKLDKVLLKMEQMEQKSDATNKSKQMEQKIDRTKMLQYILG
jgi:hypothetical protein